MTTELRGERRVAEAFPGDPLADDHRGDGGGERAGELGQRIDQRPAEDEPFDEPR